MIILLQSFWRENPQFPPPNWTNIVGCETYGFLHFTQPHWELARHPVQSATIAGWNPFTDLWSAHTAHGGAILWRQIGPNQQAQKQLRGILEFGNRWSNGTSNSQFPHELANFAGPKQHCWTKIVWSHFARWILHEILFGNSSGYSWFIFKIVVQTNLNF